MQITVILRKEAIILNGNYATVFDLFKELNLASEAYLILQEGQMIDSTAPLHDGDVIKLVPVLSGG